MEEDISMYPFVIICVLLWPFPLLLISTRKKEKIYSCFLALATIISLIFFVYMQTVINTPDHGKAVEQFFLPVAIYLVIIILAIYKIIKKPRKGTQQ